MDGYLYNSLVYALNSLERIPCKPLVTTALFNLNHQYLYKTTDGTGRHIPTLKVPTSRYLSNNIKREENASRWSVPLKSRLQSTGRVGTEPNLFNDRYLPTGTYKLIEIIRPSSTGTSGTLPNLLSSLPTPNPTDPRGTQNKGKGPHKIRSIYTDIQDIKHERNRNSKKQKCIYPVLSVNKKPRKTRQRWYNPVPNTTQCHNGR